MKHVEGTVTGAAEASIFYQYWTPAEAPRAALLVVHGLAEHGGRYARFAEYFVNAGFVVGALDLPGHGQSSGTQAYVDHFTDFGAALDGFRQRVQEDFPELPLFLVGHSMGGLVGTTYLLEHQASFVGCVLSGPAVVTEIEPPPLQMLLIRLLSLLLPRTGVLQLEANGVCRDPQEVQRYLSDPMVYTGKIPARVVAELFAGMRALQQRAADIRLPMLLLHGGEDVLAAPAGSHFLHENISSGDKTLHIYPGLYHEIFNEPEHESIFSEIRQWCEQRIPD